MTSQYPDEQVYDDEQLDSSDEGHPEDNLRSSSYGGKTLYSMSAYAPDPVFPDLSEYFSEFTLTPEQQIKYCRSYASYLSSSMPQPKKKRKLAAKDSDSVKQD